MPLRTRHAPPGVALGSPTRAPALAARAASGRVRRARRAGARGARRVTLRGPPTSTRARSSSRRARAGEPWFCFEQPDRDGAALAALGACARLDGRGPRALRERRRPLARAGRRRGQADAPDGPPGAGPGRGRRLRVRPRRRARRRTGRASPPATLTVPEVALARRGERRAAHARRARRARRRRRTSSLARARAPLARPAPRAAAAARPGAGRPLPRRLGRAARALRGGRRARRRADPRGRLREDRARARGRRCTRPRRTTPRPCSACCARRSTPATSSAPAAATRAFIGASPELLVRREGLRASTVALAGSTRRSADPAVDDHLGEQLLRSDKDREEQAIVARRIARALRPAHRLGHARRTSRRSSGWPTSSTSRRRSAPSSRSRAARSSSPGSCTRRPPSAASRTRRAAPLIPALEGLDRGWYAGAGRLDGRQRGRRVLRRAALRAAARPEARAVRGRRRRARLRPGRASSPRPRSSSARCCPCSRAEPTHRPRDPRRRGRSDVSRDLRAARFGRR